MQRSLKGLLIAAALSLASIAGAQGGTIGGGGGAAAAAAAGTLTGTTLASGVTASSLTSVTGFAFGLGTLTGGASSLTLLAGTGASRQFALQTTTSGSTATTALRFNEVQQTLGIAGSATLPTFTFAGDSITGFYKFGTDTIGITAGGTSIARILTSASGFKLVGSAAGDMRIVAGTGNYRRILFSTTGTAGAVATNLVLDSTSITVPDGNVTKPGYGFNSDGSTGIYRDGSGNVAVSVVGVNQATIAGSGSLTLPLLPAEGSTKNAMCWDGTTKAVTQNAAATCTVSARRYKENIQPLSLADAARIVTALKPSTYNEKVGKTPHIGLIAEEADSVDHRLATKNSAGQVNSVNYEEVTIALLKLVQAQQAEISSMSKQLATVQAQNKLALDSLRTAVAALTKKPVIH